MPIWSDKRCSWLALQMIPGLGNIAFKNLLARFGDPERVFQANISELIDVEGIRKDLALNIAGKKYRGDPQSELRKAKSQGIRVITYSDPAYPRALKEIYDPPMLLYLKGKDIPGNTTFIAVVGSRNATHYGLKAAEMIGQGLARRGLGVVSGMARGIDSASHWGCLRGLGFTVAVLGTGIDIIYPGSNKNLFQQITEKGAVISEFSMGTPPTPNNFPMRNRIISGLSRGVVIVEATKNSGSLITASLALEHGREVFAVPGSIESFKSTGCHFLIKQGARLIENSDDILEELGLNCPYMPKTDTFKQASMPPMDESERTIYDIIGDYPIHIDQISRSGKLEPGEVSSTLMRMELKGMIRQLPGKMFVR
ncbi:MAG: DNA-processing protein DprA [Deltaproteobacteria bacterium]|nr:DNA-processing protein DprA [Deltaproteobacteria bacterium]